MINPLIISRLIEAGYGVYLPVDGGSDLVGVPPVDHGGVDDYQIIHCACVSQDKDHSPILKCPAVAMITAACDVVTRTVWIIPKGCVEERKSLRLGKDMEEFIVPEPKSPSFKEAQKIRRERLETLEEDVRKGIERMKG